MPIDPTMAVSDGSEWAVTSGPGRAEWTVDRIAEGPAVPAEGGSSFGDMLVSQLGKLEGIQKESTDAAQAIATGEATDPTAALIAVDRARFAMQTASVLRQKSVEAIQDVLRTQI